MCANCDVRNAAGDLGSNVLVTKESRAHASNHNVDRDADRDEEASRDCVHAREVRYGR